MTVVLLGYELGTGEPVTIPFHHMVVTGLTQHAGKTTTLEALLMRAPVASVAFTTKRGEIGFLRGAPHAPYFRERADWQYVEAILEASLRERLRFERSWIMRACKGATTLRQVHDQVRRLLKTAKGIHESVYTALDHYLELVVPQIAATRWATTLDLAPRLTVMDLTALSHEMQALVIRSTIETVMDRLTGVIVVLPEAWAFLPQSRGGPVKAAADRLLHEGAVLGNYGWLDSQDLAGLDKRYLKHVGVWLLGCQPEANEAEHTLRQLPLPRGQKPAPADIQSLKRGEFYACWEGTVRKVYVRPTWLDEATARAVARGDADGRRVAHVQREPTPAQRRRFPGLRPHEVGPGGVAPRPMEEDPAMCEEHAKLATEVERLTSMTNDYADKLGKRELALKDAQTHRDQFRARAEAGTRFVEALAALAGPVGAVDMEALIEKVLARLPAGAGGAVLQVTPPEALRAEFQGAEVARLRDAVRALSPLARMQLRLLEAMPGTAVGQQQLAERLGRSWGGNARVTFVKALGELEALGLVEIQERVGVRARVRAKIEADLGFYQASAGDVDLTYQHVLAHLVESDA